MRRGWFRIASGYDFSDLLDRLSLIARVPGPYSDEVIVAESDMFEKLKPGELAPQYTITVHTHRNDGAGSSYTYDATRVR